MMSESIRADTFSFLPTLEDASFDAIITDPPYDLGRSQIDWLCSEFCRLTQGHILVFCPPENQFPATSYLFWIKPTSTKNFSRSHGRFVEMIAHVQKGNTWNQLFWANMTGVYTDILEGNRVHPHQKPYSLIKRLVKIHTNEGDKVLDPFSGSGTVEKACKALSRECVSVDIDALKEGADEQNLPG